MRLGSKGIKEDKILKRYGINSDDVEKGVPQLSFPLEWNGEPEGTESFALTFLDYDNIEEEGVMWIHWIAADIPKTVHCLEEDAGRENPWLIQGKNSWNLPYGPYKGLEKKLTEGYGGPAPNRPHEYEITIYALDQTLDLERGFFYNILRKRMRGHILDECTIKAFY